MTGPTLRPVAVASLLLGIAASAGAQVKDWPQERPPRPLAARDVKFPPYEVRTLPNGLQVIAVLHHEQPAVSLRLIIRAGAAQDPTDKPGVANLLASVLDQGTASRSAEQIADSIDSIGGALGTGSGTDLSYINAVVMKDSFDLALTLVSDVARNPAFAPREVENQRRQLLSGLKVSYEDPDYLAGAVFDRLVYGFHPYGRPASGTPESVARISREDLTAFHAKYFAPNNAILAIVGDLTTKEAFDGVERAFGSWARKDVPAQAFIEPPAPTRRVVVIDRPGAVQTEIRVGHLGVSRKHPDYMALNLAIKILGGEGANRLHRVLRSERGLTYGASADMDTLKESGDFVAETDTRSEATGEALRLIVDEVWRLQRERVSDNELQGAKDYLAGSFPLTIETPAAIALQVLNAVFYGLDLRELETFPERVDAVTPEDIQRVARTFLKPDRLSIVLVGDASAFVKQLPAVGFQQFERVPLSDLDLGAADFRHGTSRPAGRDREPPAGAPRLRPASMVIATPTVGVDDPKARALVRRMIEAKGGLQRLKALKSLKATATTVLQTPGGEVRAPTTTYISYPGRYRVELNVPQGQQIVQVFANGQGWMRGPDGAQDAPEPVLSTMRANARRDFVPVLLHLENGELTARLLPDVTGPGGQRLLALEVSGTDFPAVVLHVDPDTALLVRQTYKGGGPNGEGTTEETFSDYRSVDGIKVAFKFAVRVAGTVVQERTVMEVTINQPIDSSLFVKPA